MILNKKLENYWLILLSLPSWECGLKFAIMNGNTVPNTVAPFVGVWIEIKFFGIYTACIQVAPFVGVWIEICRDDAGYFYVTVAPFVGVWIEIRYRCCSCDRFSVAPFVGVWIEISELSLLLYFQ